MAVGHTKTLQLFFNLFLLSENVLIYLESNSCFSHHVSTTWKQRILPGVCGCANVVTKT